MVLTEQKGMMKNNCFLWVLCLVCLCISCGKPKKLVEFSFSAKLEQPFVDEDSTQKNYLTPDETFIRWEEGDAIAIDGEVDPSSITTITPAAVEEFGNVGAAIIVSIPSVCGCDSVSVRNIGTGPILVQNANIIFDYAGVQRVR